MRERGAAADAVVSLVALLDEVEVILHEPKYAAEGIRVLTDGLRALKTRVPQATWTDKIIPAARKHRVGRLICECPLTEHARTRPRGYPGDAGLLDIIYRHEAKRTTVRAASGLGRAIYDFTIAVPACEAVRQRRALAAAIIDEVARSTPDASVLSVACGNLRETELSMALRTGAIGLCMAVDQDPISLKVVEGYAAAAGGRIEPRRLTVRDLLVGRGNLPQFDLIYSIGLYDYLQPGVAARLTARLFDRLNSGGRLLIANFMRGVWEAPYMEAYMDWHLLYRTEREIRAFVSEMPETAIAESRFWTDAGDCIGYLEARRR